MNVKKLILTSIIVLGLCASSVVSYKVGAYKTEKEIWAHSALYDADRDLEYLHALKTNDYSLVISKLENDLWDSVLPIYYNPVQSDIFLDSDNMLSNIADYFRNHSVMAIPVEDMTDSQIYEMAERRAHSNGTTNSEYLNSDVDYYIHDHERNVEIKKLLQAYLKK